MSTYGPFDEHLGPVKISDITNKLWRPRDIAERIDGVTVRQIADLAERGIITPVIQAAGRGTSRIYDASGLYSIIIGLQARSFLGHAETKGLIDFLLEVEAGEKPPIMCLLKKNLFEQEHGRFEIDVFSKDDKGNWDHDLFDGPWGPDPLLDGVRLLIHLHTIKYNLRLKFRY